MQEPGEIPSREPPLERRSNGFVMTLKSQQAFFDSGQRRKIVWRERLALDNREVDLDLVEPTGVDGAVDEHQILVAALQAGHATRTSMRRAVVHDPEDTARLGVGGLGHDLVYQTVEGRDAGASLATPEDLGAVHVPRRQIGPCPFARVLVLHLQGISRLRGQGFVDARPRLDARLLVGGQHELVLLQGLALPDPLVQVKQASGLGLELRVSREDPAPMLPRLDGVFVQPAPHGATAHRSDQARAARLPGQLRGAPTGQRHPMLAWQLTRQRLDGHDHLRGKTPGAVPGESAPPSPVAVSRKNACATGLPPRSGLPRPARCRRWPCLGQPSGSSWRAIPQNTATYTWPTGAATPVPRPWSEQCYMGFFSAWKCLLCDTSIPNIHRKFNHNIR